MPAQRSAEGESYKGQSSGNLNGKMAESSKHHCQRAKRCSALEPVLEHCELAATTLPACETVLHQHGTSSAQRGKPLRFLSRLCNGYVKLMNDVASGAEFAGVTSFYGAGYGAACARDIASLPANGRIVGKETEKEQRFASQSQRPSAGA